jgi:hypothetical protein
MIDSAQITATWDRILKIWLDGYYHRSVLILSLVIYILGLGMMKKHMRFFATFLFISMIGATGFFFLYFKSLYDHDYYLINLFFLPVFVLVFGVKIILDSRFKNSLRIIVATLFTFYLIFLIKESKPLIQSKLTVFNYWHENVFFGLEDIQPQLRSLGVEPLDKVICMPDPSINISLNMMNQPGFTDYGFINKTGKERIDFFIAKGANYLLIMDKRIYKDTTKSYILPFCEHKILKYKNVDVYDLRSFRTETKSAP